MPWCCECGEAPSVPHVFRSYSFCSRECFEKYRSDMLDDLQDHGMATQALIRTYKQKRSKGSHVTLWRTMEKKERVNMRLMERKVVKWMSADL